MKPTQFSKPDGFHDLDAKQTQLIRWVEAVLLRTFSNYGYSEVTPPTLEYRDLYHPERIGDELFHQLLMSRISKAELFPAYGMHEDITQPDELQTESTRDVVLRWDLTAPVVRMFACQLLEEGKPGYLPIRVAYSGQVFQNIKPERPMEYRQTGVELIGNDSRYADLELLNLACDCMAAIGMKRWELRIGHATLFREILRSYHLTEDAQIAVSKGLEKFVFASLQANSDDELFAKYLHGVLPQLKSRKDMDAPLPKSIEGFSLQEWRVKWPNVLKENLSRNWIEHWSLTPDVVSEILELGSIGGNPDQFFPGIKPFLKTEVAKEKAEVLQWLSDRLSARGVAIKLSPAATRGIGYYTGITFEMHSPDTSTSSTQVCGGGRYNHLHEWVYQRARQTQKLRDPSNEITPEMTGKILTGVGFAFRLEETANALKNAPIPQSAVSVFVAVNDPKASQQAFDFASSLRQEKISVMCHLIQSETPSPMENQIRYAKETGCEFVAAFGMPDMADDEILIIQNDTKQVMQVQQALEYLANKSRTQEVLP